jgi:hypothetical protein
MRAKVRGTNIDFLSCSINDHGMNINKKLSLDQIQEFITKQAKENRSMWKREMCESEDIEKYGFNEFVGGKADAYEDCLDEIKRLNSRLFSEGLSTTN